MDRERHQAIRDVPRRAPPGHRAGRFAGARCPRHRLQQRILRRRQRCIAGCHEILRRQGLLEGIWCLDPAEGLSPGQMQEIDRVCQEHADLGDDDFVAARLQKWLA